MITEPTFDLQLPDGEEPGAGANRQPASWQDRLPGLLRILGAGVLLITMYSFLVDGWRNGNDSLRYLMMLGHTGALAAIGLASLRWLNEAKSARLLLSLALVAVPANFAILGALVFSAIAGADPSTYPQYLAWQASSPMAVGVLGLGALLVLVPLTCFGFRVLARDIWARLAGLFLFNSALLLAPVRDGDTVALMVTAMLGVTLWLNRRLSGNRHSAGTREGMLAFALPFLPLAIVTGRSLWLYAMDFFLLAAACLAAYFFLRQLSAWLGRESRLQGVVELVSIVPALGLSMPLAGIMETWHVQELVLPVAGMGSAVLFHDLAQRSVAASLYRWFAGFLVLATQGVSLLLCDSLFAALLMAGTGLALVTLAFRQKQRSMLVIGALLIGVALAYQLCSLVFHFELGSWLGLGALGVLAILTASVLESRGGRLAESVKYRWQRFSAWEV